MIVTIENGSSMTIVCQCHCRLTGHFQKQSSLEVESQGEFWVERIIDWGLHDNGTLMYLVKWENYSEDENSWEFEQHVSGCDQLLTFFKTESTNGRHPPKFSFEEYDKFVDYLDRLVTLESPSTHDLALMTRLVKGKVNNVNLNNVKVIKEVSDSLKAQLHRLKEVQAKITSKSNAKRLELVPILKEMTKTLHINKTFGSITEFFEFFESRKQTIKRLKKLENDYNKIIEEEKEGTAIKISNYIDTEVPQLERYVTDYIMDMNIVKNMQKVESEEPVVCCECKDCYESKDECCSAVNGFPLVYQKNGRLSQKQSERDLIFECNSKCKCDKDCANRQVQRGRSFELEIFRTESKGWGVRTLEKIPKGSFITHYPGEVVSLIEAGNRPTTYLYDLGAHLDSTDVEFTYVVDASKYGNVARFVNHACAPNCRTLFTWIDRSANNLLPIIALFAIKDIRPYEELTYDYSMEVIDYYERPDDDMIEMNLDSGSVKEANKEEERPFTPSSDSSEPIASSSSSKVNRNVDNRTQNIVFKRIKCECGAPNCKQFLYS